VAVEGKAVATVADLARELERIGIGKTATLTVLRGGSRVDVEVQVQDIS
jgi:S1-C subfamily serine protease